MLIYGGKTQERKIKDQINKNKDIKEDEERLKGQEKIENTFISSLIFFCHDNVLRSSFQYC